MTRRAHTYGRFALWLSRTRFFERYCSELLTRVDRYLIPRTGRGVSAPFEGVMRLMTLTTTGAKTREPRTVPLAYLNESGAMYVVGTNFGRAHHPGWAVNLVANPAAEVQSREWSGPVEAQLIDPESAELLWPKWSEMFEDYEMYRQATPRDIRMFRLHPQ